MPPAAIMVSPVNHASSNAGLASVPQIITVPAGAQTAQFPIITTNVKSTRKVMVTATQGGISQTAAVTIKPLALSVVKLSASTVVGGKTLSKNKVVLDGPRHPLFRSH